MGAHINHVCSPFVIGRPGVSVEVPSPALPLSGTDPEEVISNAFACFDEEGTGKINEERCAFNGFVVCVCVCVCGVCVVCASDLLGELVQEWQVITDIIRHKFSNYGCGGTSRGSHLGIVVERLFPSAVSAHTGVGGL